MRSRPAWLVIEASAREKQVQDRSGRTLGLVRAFVSSSAPLRMPKLNLRTIEPLMTVPFALVNPKLTQAGDGNALPFAESRA